MAFKTAPAFVDSVWEMFGPLLAGLPLVAVPRSAGRDPAQVCGLRMHPAGSLVPCCALLIVYGVFVQLSIGECACEFSWRASANQTRMHANLLVPPLPSNPTYVLQLLRTLADHSITHCAAVPTLWRSLVAAMRQDGSTAARLRLRLAVSSGEPLPPGLLHDMQQVLPPGCRILNLYGSTEVAADCTAFDCTAWGAQQGQQQGRQQGQHQQQAGEEQPPAEQPSQQQRVPVGQPISGTLVAVLAPEPTTDAAARDGGQPQFGERTAAAAGERAVLPLGSIGEVAVAGVGLAAGYLCAHPAAEAAQRRRFVRLPTQQLSQAQAAGGSVAAAADLPPAFWQQGNICAFLTGDLGWLDAAGCLHLLGRQDHQVKISGGCGGLGCV